MQVAGLLVALVIIFAVEASIGIPIKLGRLADTLREELEYRKSNVHTYRHEIQTKLSSSIRTLSNQQRNAINKAKNDLDEYTVRCKALYKDVMLSSEQKQRMLDNLNLQVGRSGKLDESLETFRKFYRRKIERSARYKPTWKSMQDILPYGMLQNWKRATNLSLRKASAFLTVDGPRFTELKLEQSLQELSKLQDDFKHKVKSLNHTVSAIFPAAVSKEDVRIARDRLEKQLKHLETEGNLWVEERVKRIDATVREWQAKLTQRERVLDDLVNRRQATVHYTQLSDDTLDKVLDLIDPKAEGWNVVKSDNGVTVYRKLLHPGSAGAQYACVKCYGEVNASPQRVYQLLADTTRTREYNSLYDTGREIEVITPDTKVVHSKSVAIFPFKPRDFVYLVHQRKLRDGTMVVLNRATEHVGVPKEQAGYTRGSILLAAHIIQPVASKPEHSRLTMITQVDPGGFAPPGIINQLCTLGPIGFMKNVEIAANR